MLPNAQIKAADPAVKFSSGYTTSTNGNGNGSDALSGAGLAHRKWTLAERIAYAADVATGVKHLDLSQGQLCLIFHITPGALRAEIKARNGNRREEVLADARTNLREIVDEVGLDAAMNLLSEMETQLQMQCGLYPMSK
jgi:hypothetical protein